MGSIGKDEYVWYQILVQDEGIYEKKKPKFFVNKVTGERFTLKEIADERKKQIRTAGYMIKGEKSIDEFGVAKKIDGKPDSEGKPTKIDATYVETKAISKKEMDLSKEDKDELEAINKKLSKPLALTVTRLMYVTKNETFNGSHIQDVLSILKPFGGINSFSPSPTDPYDFPWQNIGKRRVAWRSEEKFDEYVRREGFFPLYNEREGLDAWEDIFFWPYSMKTRRMFRMLYEIIFHPFSSPEPTKVSILNMEELATMWHFPGQVASTPTLPRIESMKGVAPVNLPQ